MFWLFTLIILALLLTYAIGGHSAAPWVPCRTDDVARIMKIANIKQGDNVIGSRTKGTTKVKQFFGNTQFVSTDILDTAYVRRQHYDVTFGNGQFVAAGNRIFTSPDGLQWTLRFESPDDYFNAVTFGAIALIAGPVDDTIAAPHRPARAAAADAHRHGVDHARAAVHRSARLAAVRRHDARLAPVARIAVVALGCHLARERARARLAAVG